MTGYPPFSMMLVLAFVGPLHAADFEADADRLKDQRDRAVAKVIAPIDQQYKTALEELLKKATQANALDAAVVIRKRLEALDPDAKTRFIEGTEWKKDSGDTTLYFREKNEFREKWNKENLFGTWEVISKNEIKVTMKSSKVHVYTVSDDGWSITRSGDGLVWKRLK